MVPFAAITAACAGALVGCPATYDLGTSTLGMPTEDVVTEARISDGEASLSEEQPEAAVSDGGFKRMFVTSDTFSPLFALPTDRHSADILPRADVACQTAADRATLGGTWRTWLFASRDTTEEIHPEDRMGSKGPYYLLDGTLVFDGPVPTDVVFAAPSLTEKGTYLEKADFAWVGSFGISCESIVDGKSLSWTSAAAGHQARIGTPTNSVRWNNNGSHDCDALGHLYCFEQ